MPSNPCAAGFLLVAEGVLGCVRGFRRSVGRRGGFWVVGEEGRFKYLWEAFRAWLELEGLGGRPGRG